MTSGLDRQAPCPSCGASITFPFGGARAVVCDHCSAVVARTDQGLTATGRMGALLELPTPFQLHRSGTWHGEPFEVQGVLQMDRADQASAPWQEVLVHFPMRDSHTWVAYAQGRWYATNETSCGEGALPPFASLSPGMNVDLGPHGAWVVQEISQRRVVSGRGAMTGLPVPGVITRYADISAAGDRFGTLDYGDGGEPPVLYLGRIFDPAEVQFDDGMPLEAPQAQVSQVECPNCGGSLPIQSQSTERVICQYCGTASDMRQGTLAALGPAPMPPIAPAIPIGQQGEFRGQRFVVTGFMIRSCVVEGVRYDWREYLLFGGESLGYRWLTEEDGSWSFVEPLDAGAVQDSGNTVVFRGQACAFAQSVQATVDYVIGEFYWKVEIGETVEATEFRGATGKISRERTAQEINYAVVMPTSRAELASFGLAAPAPAIGGGARKSSRTKFLVAGCAALVLLPIVFAGVVMTIAVASARDFEDVESGEVALDEGEVAAVKKLIRGADLPASSVRVYDDETSDCNWCKGIIIERGHVTMVRLESKGITSTAPLAALDRLEVLRLPKNEITAVEGLGALSELETVDLSGNRITELSDMSGAKSLEKMDLRNNQLTSLSGIRGLPKLAELRVEGNPIASLEGLGGLASLERLELRKAKLKSFEGLGELPKLKVLSAKGVGLTSLAGLDGLTRLEELHVPDNQLASLSTLAPLPKLRFIDASRNRIASLEGVEDFPALKRLHLAHNQIRSLEGEEGSPTLEKLALENNLITEVDAVAPMPRLKELKLDDNRLVALGGVTALAGLGVLSLSGNRLPTLEGASAMRGLTKLKVANNRLKTLDPIVGMPKLQNVDARNNRISNVGAKAFLAKPPRHYDLSGNLGLPSSVLRRGSYLPSSSSRSGRGSRSPSSRYRSGGGPRFGK